MTESKVEKCILTSTQSYMSAISTACGESPGRARL